MIQALKEILELPGQAGLRVIPGPQGLERKEQVGQLAIQDQKGIPEPREILEQPETPVVQERKVIPELQVQVDKMALQVRRVK